MAACRATRAASRSSPPPPTTSTHAASFWMPAAAPASAPTGTRTPPMAAIRKSRGFTMIEVLVSLVITVIGLLGLIGMQAFSHQAELESYQRAQALILLNDIVEKINANRQSAGCYAFTGVGARHSSALPPAATSARRIAAAAFSIRRRATSPTAT